MTTHRPSIVPSRLVPLLAVLLFAACGGAASAPNQGTVGTTTDRLAMGVPTSGPAIAPGASAASAQAAGGPAANSQPLDAAKANLLIIKTGTLDLQVKDVGAATSAAATAIGALGGYVSGSQQSGDGDSITASITYRIPSDRWADALSAMRSLAVKVVGEATQTQDVTGQVVDLTARITNLQVTERALQAIMAQATKITDVLAVQTELTRVRGDIEQATAEKAHLQEQASYSTLTVTFGLQPIAAVALSQQKFDPKSQVDRATASLVDILQGLATAGIWFAIVWLPILVVVGVLALIALAIVRRRGRSTGLVAAPAMAVDGPGPTTEQGSTPPTNG